MSFFAVSSNFARPLQHFARDCRCACQVQWGESKLSMLPNIEIVPIPLKRL